MLLIFFRLGVETGSHNYCIYFVMNWQVTCQNKHQAPSQFGAQEPIIMVCPRKQIIPIPPGIWEFLHHIITTISCLGGGVWYCFLSGNMMFRWIKCLAEHGKQNKPSYLSTAWYCLLFPRSCPVSGAHNQLNLQFTKFFLLDFFFCLSSIGPKIIYIVNAILIPGFRSAHPPINQTDCDFFFDYHWTPITEAPSFAVSLVRGNREKGTFLGQDAGKRPA